MTDREQKRAETLFDAITGVEEPLLAQAKATPLRAPAKRPRWLRPAALAACAVLVVGLTGRALLRGWMPGGAGAGGSGHDEGSTFMSYAGPVFPLNVTGEDAAAPALTARRAITLDFAPYAPRTECYEAGGELHSYEAWNNEVLVTDAYTITNPTGQDITCTGVYPFAGALCDGMEYCPQITVDGRTLTEAETALCAGPYSGGFQDTRGGSGEGDERWNLADLNSWQQYQALLQSGEYYARATGARPTLEQRVTVYKFTDFTADHDAYPAATQQIAFSADGAATMIFTYGINGRGWNDATGEQYCDYFVPEPQSAGAGLPRYLIVLGQDIGDYTLQGYQDGGCEPGQEIDGVSCAVQRYQGTLGEVLAEILTLNSQVYGTMFGVARSDTLAGRLTPAQVLALNAELMYDYGLLSGDPAERYQGGLLEDILSETDSMSRVFYLQFELKIPAGGSVTVSAAMAKQGSFDFAGSGSENTGIDGYDLLTGLGSSLKFTGQTAALANTEWVELVRQNFGFDPANGVRRVELDPAQEHYYLEVRRVTAQQDPAEAE